MSTLRYRLIAEIEVPETAFDQHALELHFQTFVDDACRVLANGTHRLDQGLFSVAPVMPTQTAQEAACTPNPPPMPDFGAVDVSDSLSGRQDGVSSHGVEL